MARKNFTGTKAEYTSPAVRAWDITPHDSNEESLVFRGLYVGGAGDVEVVDMKDNATVFHAVPAGTILPVMGVRVGSTNTTATDIVGLA